MCSTRSNYTCAPHWSGSEPSFSFAGPAGELLEKLPDRDVEVVVDSTAVNVFARQQEPGARGEARRSAIMPPEDDFGAERVTRETNNRSDLVARKLAQRISEREVMGRDVDR